MSGLSFNDTCSKCGNPNMECSTDHKPHSTVSGVCLECGFTYDTKDDQMTLEEVNNERRDLELEPLEALATQTS